MPVKVDQATKSRDKLGFARVLLEMKIDGCFPDTIVFLNEHGHEHVQAVHFEWKPIKCGKCGLLGHNEGDCRKAEGQKRKRRPKRPVREEGQKEAVRQLSPHIFHKENEAQPVEVQEDVRLPEEDQVVHSIVDPINWDVVGVDPGVKTPVANSFEALQNEEGDEVVVGQVHCGSPRLVSMNHLGHG